MAELEEPLKHLARNIYNSLKEKVKGTFNKFIKNEIALRFYRFWVS